MSAQQTATRASAQRPGLYNNGFQWRCSAHLPADSSTSAAGWDWSYWSPASLQGFMRPKHCGACARQRREGAQAKRRARAARAIEEHVQVLRFLRRLAA